MPRATMETGIIVPKIISGVAPIEMGIMGPKDYLWSGSDRVDATWTKTLSSKLSKLILSALFTFSIFRTTPCIMASGTFWSLFMAFMTRHYHWVNSCDQIVVVVPVSLDASKGGEQWFCSQSLN